MGSISTLSSQLNGRYNIVSKLGHIRKLTPRETYLLQGFNEDDYYKVKHLSSNSLFMQAGNSISVPVLEEIFKKLFADIDIWKSNNDTSKENENTYVLSLN